MTPDPLVSPSRDEGSRNDVTAFFDEKPADLTGILSHDMPFI